MTRYTEGYQDVNSNIRKPKRVNIGSVSDSDISYLEHVTSDIQAQIDNKHPLIDNIAVHAIDGAIAEKEGIIRINKAGICALTLAVPIAVTDDGKYLNILSETAYAHTVTATNLLMNGTAGSPLSVATFAVYPGAGITLLALGGYWYITANRACTIS